MTIMPYVSKRLGINGVGRFTLSPYPGIHEVDWREYSQAHSLDPVKEIPEIVEWFAKVMKE